MRLLELEASFLKLKPDGMYLGTPFSDADGIIFLCPKCFQDAGSKAGVHSIICWFEDRVPDDAKPSGRWKPVGTGLDDLTFVPGKNPLCSVMLLGGCRWHGFIKNGDAS